MSDDTKSFSKLSWLKRISGTDLTPAERCVLVTVFNYTNSTGGNAHPGNKRLVADTGLKERAVRGILRRLEARDWLRTTRYGGRGPASMATTYALGRGVPAVAEPDSTLDDPPMSPEPAELYRHGGADMGAPGRPQSGTAVPPNRSVSDQVSDQIVSPGVRSPGADASNAHTNSEPQNSEEEEDLTYLDAAWKPNRAHHATLKTYGLDPNEVVGQFQIQHVARRRSDWNSTFGAYIDAHRDGRQEEIFRGWPEWFVKAENWVTHNLNRGCTIEQIEQHLQRTGELERHQRNYLIDFCKQSYETDAQMESR